MARFSSDSSKKPGRRVERARKPRERTEVSSVQPREQAPIKLQKFLAEQGLGSRRALEVLIEQGAVTVNGVVAQIGQRVTGTERIEVQGRALVQHRYHKPFAQEVLLYHKPEGKVCTRSDESGRPTVFEDLPRLGEGQGRWIMVGRLDLNTSGLLLFTNDGALAHQWMHPSSGIEREYAVRIYGEVTAEMIDRLVRGVELEDGLSRFVSVVDGGGEGKNHWYHVVLTRGKQREVRRLFESQGVTVSRLIRVRFGGLLLPPRLPKGKFMRLTPEDIACVSSPVQHK